MHNPIFLFTFKVPLGILLKNVNKSSEMIEILIHLHQYIPIKEYARSIYFIVKSIGKYRISLHFRVYYILANLASKIHIAKIGIAKINVCIH